MTIKETVQAPDHHSLDAKLCAEELALAIAQRDQDLYDDLPLTMLGDHPPTSISDVK